MSQGCTIVSWLLLPCFCIPSFSRLANAWTCLFELRESKEAEWSLSSVQFSSVQSLSRVWLFVTPWTAAHQASLYITGVYSDSCPLRQWCHPTISFSVIPFSYCPQSYQVAKVLEFQPQNQSFQWIFRTDLLEDGLVWSPCSPRNSQESSPTSQFKSKHQFFNLNEINVLIKENWERSLPFPHVRIQWRLILKSQKESSYWAMPMLASDLGLLSLQNCEK